MNREELYQKYIVENLPRKECAEYFGLTERTLIRRLETFGIKKDSKQRYKNIQKVIKEHYGTDSTFGSEKIREKSRQTMLERYGVEYTNQSETLKNKMQQTLEKRYGKKNYVETNSFKEKSKNTCLEKYGVETPCQYPQCIKALQEAIGNSKPENEFSNILNKYNIEYEKEFPIRGFKYDFKVGNILFEINPSGTHNSDFGIFGHKPKNKMYHYTKYSVAKEFGYHCVHIFDWDDAEKIVKLFLLPKRTFYARNCQIKEVERAEAVTFLKENHLQGYANDSIRIGLYQNDELVEIMTFGKPRYNNNFEYELIRYCNSAHVIGGAEKIMAYFKEKYAPKSIISYCDLAKFSGEIYKKLGFRVINKPKPSKHWVNLKTNQHITDNLLRKNGFDQLFKTNYGKGTSNEQLMLENDFVGVYDCGQLSFSL